MSWLWDRIKDFTTCGIETLESWMPNLRNTLCMSSHLAHASLLVEIGLSSGDLGRSVGDGLTFSVWLPRGLTPLSYPLLWLWVLYATASPLSSSSLHALRHRVVALDLHWTCIHEYVSNVNSTVNMSCHVVLCMLIRYKWLYFVWWKISCIYGSTYTYACPYT